MELSNSMAISYLFNLFLTYKIPIKNRDDKELKKISSLVICESTNT